MSPLNVLAETLRGLITLAAVFFGALLAMWFGVRRTKHERRWTAKYEAYERIFAAIEDVRFWVSETISDVHFLPTVGGKTAEDLTDRYYEAQRVLSSYVHVGHLVISEEARDQLEQLMQDIWREEHRYREDPRDDEEHDVHLSDHVHNLQTIIQAHLPGIEKQARVDLG